MSRRSDLQRSYGFFRCSDCGKSWESSHVYTKYINGKFQAQYGQECKDCRIMCMPYRVERLKCSKCGLQEGCTCTWGDGEDKRHIDASKAHRRDLCGKCQAGRPCNLRRF